MITISVPGSILLLGEYSILEPDMRGLSMAVEPRLTLTAERSQTWTIIAKGCNEPACFMLENISRESVPVVKQTSGFSWANTALLQIVIEQFIKIESKNPFVNSGPYVITIDSSNLFHENKKLGLGSSAGVVIVFSAFLFLLAQLGKLTKEQLLDFCIPTHKFVQNGRGSGYDILTSIEGGLLFFSMSSYHYAEKIMLDAFDAEIWCAMNEVKTASAINSYECYKNKHPLLTKIFWNKTQNLVNDAYRIIASMQQQSGSTHKLTREQIHYHKLVAVLRKAGRVNVRFGSAIGVSAQFPIQSKSIMKSLGAGNEMALSVPHYLLDNMDESYDRLDAEQPSVFTRTYSTNSLYVFPCKPTRGIVWEYV
ncbi:MAG TPA: hypothetical protein P5519_02305 [Spirochaetia bacterium]|nr:hypothetical protein [Spirochaetales bacterium]HRS64708.1 hypothetical protein [Spirochaetia bacterium]HOT59181.1 hypothetical protein [Spirochaetales bacterium]HPD80535.1 hypothetical protein [Spirochaetales bacterium]HQG39947.1 hypothetical protein [Spirochaetales bacterium]